MKDKDIDHANHVIDAEVKAVNSIRKTIQLPAFKDAIALLSQCSGKILVTGSGTSGAVANRGAHLLSVAGTPAFYLSPNDGLHGGLGVLTKNDIVLALSKGGNSAELTDFCIRAKTLCDKLIVITAKPQSHLANIADKVLYVPLEDDCDLGGMIATGSSLAFSALIDVMVELTRIERGYQWESFFFTHPAGDIGVHADESLQKLNK